jgi:hypothetical protein
VATTWRRLRPFALSFVSWLQDSSARDADGAPSTRSARMSDPDLDAADDVQRCIIALDSAVAAADSTSETEASAADFVTSAARAVALLR